MMWNEMEYFLRSYCVTPEHNSILTCLLECRSKPDTHSTSSSARTASNDTTDDTSNKKQTTSTNGTTTKATDSEWAWKELNQWTRHEFNQMSDKQTINTTPEPSTKKFKTNSVESVSNKMTSGPQSLLNIWTNKLNEDNSKKRFEFMGRTTSEGNIAKLYVNLNEKNETQ